MNHIKFARAIDIDACSAIKEWTPIIMNDDGAFSMTLELAPLGSSHAWAGAPCHDDNTAYAPMVIVRKVYPSIDENPNSDHKELLFAIDPSDIDALILSLQGIKDKGLKLMDTANNTAYRLTKYGIAD